MSECLAGGLNSYEIVKSDHVVNPAPDQSRVITIGLNKGLHFTIQHQLVVIAFLDMLLLRDAYRGNSMTMLILAGCCTINCI